MTCLAKTFSGRVKGKTLNKISKNNLSFKALNALNRMSLSTQQIALS